MKVSSELAQNRRNWSASTRDMNAFLINKQYTNAYTAPPRSYPPKTSYKRSNDWQIPQKRGRRRCCMINRLHSTPKEARNLFSASKECCYYCLTCLACSCVLAKVFFQKMRGQETQGQCLTKSYGMMVFGWFDHPEFVFSRGRHLC